MRNWPAIRRGVHAAVGASLKASVLRKHTEAKETFQQTSFGVQRDFFKERPTERAGYAENKYWTPRMTRFAKNSAIKKNNNNVLGRGRVAFPKWRRRVAGPPPNKLAIASARRIAFVGTSDEQAVVSVGCQIQLGQHRCASADVVVMGSLQPFFAEPEQLSEDWLIHLVYIIGTGRQVVLQSQWALSDNAPPRVPPDEVISHILS